MRETLVFVLSIFVLLNTAFAHKDITNTYYHAWDHSDERIESVLPKLRKLKILLVPGFLSDAVIELGPWGLQATHLGEYFDTQIKWMRSPGVDLDVQRVDPNTFPAWKSQSSVKHNADVLAEVVRGSSKPVLIIAHSKGGLDTLDMLVRHPELRGIVKGFIAIQSPFEGSPIADCVTDQNGLSTVAFGLLKMLGGTKDSLLDLRTGVRARYLHDNATEIQAVIREVPMLSIGSTKTDEPYKWDTLLELFRDKMDGLGLENDGLVPLAFSKLHGVDHVAIRSNEAALSGIDHAVTVMECQFITFDRVRFMNTILTMLHDRMR